MKKSMIALLVLVLFSACMNKSQDVVITTEQNQLTTADTTITEAKTDNLTTEGAAEGTVTVTTSLSDETQVLEQVDLQLSLMTIEEKVGQLFYLDVQSYEATGIPAGGIIFFKNNLTTWDGTIEMIDGYQKASEIPLFIGIDEEGGIVTRITGEGSIGGTPVSSAWNLSHDLSDMTVAEASAVIVKELSELGFNMNFAPVADINTNPDNPIIGKRAYFDLPEPTASFVLEALGPYEDSEVTPVVKHFPGHGNTKGDSHLDTVYVEGDLATLKAHELIPFQGAVDYGVEVVMMGHIKLPDAVIDQSPASLNKEVIQGLLREQMGFEGLVISDSLIMGSITNYFSPIEVGEKGLRSGLNMLLMPENPQEVYTYLVEQGTDSEEMLRLIDDSVRRILLLKNGGR